jgi:hypothetical protein
VLILLRQMDGDGNVDVLKSIGFDVLSDFEEVSCDASTFTMLQPATYGEGTSLLGKGAAVEKKFGTGRSQNAS